MPITTWRKIAVASLLLACLICTGCGDVFRPVANPIQGPTPNPRNYHFAVVASQNAPGNPGSGMQIDVSGDTDVGVVSSGSTGIATPGQGPIHAALLGPSAGRVYVANGANDSVSTFTPASTVGSIGAVTTISLPTGSDPVFVHSTEAANMYVANSCPIPALAPACTGPNVAVINTGSNLVTNLIPVGANPITLAETPDGKKLYSVNQGAASVTPINTVDGSVGHAVSGFANPVWAVASLDSSQVFVLDQASGVVSAINTFTDVVVSTTQPAGPGANFMFLDGHLNRLYVTNPTSNTLSIYDVAVSNANGTPAVAPSLIATVPIPVPAPLAMVTALKDGSRAYVASSQLGSCAAPLPTSDPCAFTRVTVIRTSDNAVIKSIAAAPVDIASAGLAGAQQACASARFPVSIASSLDSSRVYVANCFAGNTSIFRTSDDTAVLNLISPVSAYTPVVGLQPPPQNPVWVVATP